MAAKVDPAKEKAKRQKLIVIVGGVILLALLAFQLPRTLKMLKSPAADATSASTTSIPTSAAGSTPLAPPSLDGSSPVTASAQAGSGSGVDTSSDGVRDASAPLPADAGQLVSFSRFKSKDPFEQQVTACGTPGCETAAAASAPAAAPATGTSAGGTTGSSTGVATPVRTPAAASLRAPARAATAAISVNGTVESVAVGKRFPAADPVFVLVRLTRTKAVVSIAGGSLESGALTVALRKGKRVTLQNTGDGTRYVLQLLRIAA